MDWMPKPQAVEHGGVGCSTHDSNIGLSSNVNCELTSPFEPGVLQVGKEQFTVEGGGGWLHNAGLC